MFDIILNSRRRFIRDSIKKLFVRQQIWHIEITENRAGDVAVTAKGIGFQVYFTPYETWIRGQYKEEVIDEDRDKAHEVKGALALFTPGEIKRAVSDLKSDSRFWCQTFTERYGLRTVLDRRADCS